MIISNDEILRRLPESVKIGVNLPVTTPALEKCVEINAALRALVPGVVDFGPGGTSSPHVTVAMGVISTRRMKALIDIIAEEARLLREPIGMTFSRPYRETVTGRYLLADVLLGDIVLEWRIDMMVKLASMFSEMARTSEKPHLTLGLAESNAEKVDVVLTHADWDIPPCTVDRLHVSLSGAKGVKSDIIAEVAFADR